MKTPSAVKIIAAVAAIAATAFNIAFALDSDEFYGHYFAGVMSTIALFVILDDDVD